MKKTLFLIILLMVLVTSCSAPLDNKKVSEFSDPMTENLLQGLNNDNFQEFSADFGPAMKNVFTEEQFVKLKEQLQVIGKYESKEFAKAIRQKHEGVQYIVVNYKTSFTNEEGDVVVTISFTTDDNPKIEGIFFNSPKLIESAR